MRWSAACLAALLLSACNGSSFASSSAGGGSPTTGTSTSPGLRSPSPQAIYSAFQPGWKVFVSANSSYRVDYPPTWFVHPHAGAEDNGDISSENQPAPLRMTPSGVWLHIDHQATDQASCSKWYADQRDGTIPYSVAGASGDAYTTTPVSGAEIDWGRGAEFWIHGQCLNLFFSHTSLASRDRNRAVEYQIIDTLRLLF